MNSNFFFRPEDLDVKIDGQQLCVTASQDLGEGGGARSRVFEQRSADDEKYSETDFVILGLVSLRG